MPIGMATPLQATAIAAPSGLYDPYSSGREASLIKEI